jgi:hypothetical protein
VALRISLTVFSALSGMRLLACLIVAPQWGYDEPEFHGDEKLLIIYRFSNIHK